MKTLCRSAPLCALFWSALAYGQAPPPPPAPPRPPPAPAPAPPAPPPPAPEPVPPVSGDVTSVRPPDTPPPAPVDQGPDTLPSLEEEEPAAAASAPVVPVVKETPRPPPPVRADRRIALLGELGWNGLAGFGAIVAYHANPHVTVELGAGLAVVGAKLGLRTRYNFTEKSVTPFVGLGFMAATGYDAPTRDLAAEEGNPELNIELKPSGWMQAVAGLDWTSRDGFTLIGAVGHAWLLTGDNIVIVTGEPTKEERKGIDIVFRSGIVLSIAIGYSFR